MGIVITSGKGATVREQVLACYDAQPDAVLTCSQLFSIVDIVEHKTDMADALRQMVANHDLELGPERPPGEQGGMKKGAGARPVKTYRRPVMTAGEREKLEAVLSADVASDDGPETPMIDLATSCWTQPDGQEETDPLFAVIDQLPLAVWVPDGMQRAARLRRLAGRLEAAAPDLAAELYEDASILEDLAA